MKEGSNPGESAQIPVLTSVSRPLSCQSINMLRSMQEIESCLVERVLTVWLAAMITSTDNSDGGISR